MNTRELRRLLVMLCLCTAVLLQRTAHADTSPVGYWVTVDDDGKKATSVIKIVMRGDKLYGTIVKLLNTPEKDPKCKACKGAKKDKPIVGMEILWSLVKDGDEWSGGHVLDPKNGTEYRCYIEVVNGGKQLKVRGYVGIALLGRTQYWRRVSDPAKVVGRAANAPHG